jgi:glycosyltransferase involved in cell wall biosynthesis
MLEQVCRYYGEPGKKAVVHNGRDPDLFTPHAPKEDYAISVGRLWDAGKQALLLLRNDLPILTVLVGTPQSPEGAVASAQSARRFPKLLMTGPQPDSELRKLLAHAGIYIATSRYEPFGLAPLEAALSGCAIVANDIPTLREVWGDAAIYFERNNAKAMLLAIQELASNPTRRFDYGARALERAREQYSSERMAEDYLQLYRALVSTKAAAA